MRRNNSCSENGLVRDARVAINRNTRPLASRALRVAHFYMRPYAPSSHIFAPCNCRLLPLCAVTAFLLSRSTFLSAQNAPLDIDAVVRRLQANLDRYDSSIPSLLADEQIDSIQHQLRGRGSSANSFETIAESVFRLKRQIDPATNTYSLNESRDVNIIDGKPAMGRHIDAPAMIFGAFSGGLAFVSQDERGCMQYQLEKIRPGKPIVVHYQTASAIPHPDDCILAERSSGRVWIDPASMQIVRIEVDVPRHLVTPVLSDGRKVLPTMTHWHIEVAYRPVALNNHTFWLPVTISSICSNAKVEWSFRAAYHNYHLLEVNSRIVVPGEQ